MSSLNKALKELQSLSQTLTNANIEHALGGSGLLYALGINVKVNDWDITTNCSLDKMIFALKNYDYLVLGSNDNYSSDYLIKASLNYFEVDIIGKFAINTESGKVFVNTVITDNWNTVPLGCPKEWYKAYVAMKRIYKAELLAKYLTSTG